MSSYSEHREKGNVEMSWQ